jgi:ribose transport system permease protein
MGVRAETGASIGSKRYVNGLWSVVIGHYPLILFCLTLVLGSILSPRFLTQYNIVNVFTSNVSIFILSIGMFFVVVTGGIDLSVGAALAFAGTVLAEFVDSGMVWYTAVALTLGIMVIPGLVSGIAVAYAGVQPFIATLAMMSVLRGLAYIIQTGSPKLIFDDNLIFLGDGTVLKGLVPVPLLICAFVVVICGLVFRFTPFGRKLYAMGDNRGAAHLSGIPVRLYLVLVYAISSLLAGISGIIAASRLMMGSAGLGSGYEMDAIAAIVIGGGNLAGGTGGVLNTILGASVFAIVSNVMNLMGVSGYPQMIIKGGIIIAALIAVGRRSR